MFANANPVASVPDPTLLTYSELSRLSPQRQVEYIEGVRSLLLELSQMKDSRLSDLGTGQDRESRITMMARLEQWLKQVSRFPEAYASENLNRALQTIERCVPSSGPARVAEFVPHVGNFSCTLSIEVRSEEERQTLRNFQRNRIIDYYRNIETLQRDVVEGRRTEDVVVDYSTRFEGSFFRTQRRLTNPGTDRTAQANGDLTAEEGRARAWRQLALEAGTRAQPAAQPTTALGLPPVSLVAPRVAVPATMPPPPQPAPASAPPPIAAATLQPPVAAVSTSPPREPAPVAPPAPIITAPVPQPVVEVAPIPPPARPASLATATIAQGPSAVTAVPTDVNRPLTEAERARRQRAWPEGVFGPFSSMEIQRGACGENGRLAHHDEASGVWFCLTEDAQRKVQTGEIELPQLRSSQLPVDRCAPVPMVCEPKAELRRQFWGTQGVKCLIAGVVSELEPVPGRPDDKRCRVPGEFSVGERRFRCGPHQSICNPLLFGSVNEQTPVCMGRGSDVTARCARVSTAHDAHRFLSRHTPGIQETWDQLRNGLREVCAPSSVSGRFHCEECNLIRQRLFELNAKIVGRERACENADHLDRIRENLPLNATTRQAPPRSAPARAPRTSQ